LIDSVAMFVRSDSYNTFKLTSIDSVAMFVRSDSYNTFKLTSVVR